MGISCVVLTHNDVDTFARCLESLRWCDEVIVVDDGSSDGTIELAKKLGAKVCSRKLRGNFAAQRNFGLSKAKNRWVLFVDSDEVVTKELAKEIKLLTQQVIPAQAGIQSGSKDGSPIRSGMTGPLGYFIKRKDFFLGKWLAHGETENVRLLRLAIKDAGRWNRPVHEVCDVQSPVGELTHPLLHYPHPSVAQFLEEINNYSTLSARYLYDQGVRVSWWQIIVFPKLKFFHNYIWRLGFLDGTAGAIVAFMMSFHSFLVRAKLHMMTSVKEKS